MCSDRYVYAVFCVGAICYVLSAMLLTLAVMDLCSRLTAEMRVGQKVTGLSVSTGNLKGKVSPYSITECRVLELILVLGSR